MSYEPGTYSKGDSVRVAETTSDAVDLVWNGFSRVTADGTEVGYRELQAQARSLGLPTSGKKADLAKAIAEFQPDEAPAQGTPSEVPDTSDGQVSTDPTTDTPTAPTV